MAASTSMESVFYVEPVVYEYYHAWSGTDVVRVVSYYAENVVLQIPDALTLGKEAVRDQSIKRGTPLSLPSSPASSSFVSPCAVMKTIGMRDPSASSSSQGGGFRKGFIDGEFSVTGGGTIFGNLGRNILRGPDQRNVDMALTKRTRLTEKVGLVFRWEVFNLFNRTNFANPASDISSPSTFAKISAMGVNPRIMQFGLKMEF